MKKTLIVVVTLTIMILTTKIASANDAKKVGKFLLGMATGYAAHESGHEIMALTEDESLKWESRNGQIEWQSQSDSAIKKAKYGVEETIIIKECFKTNIYAYNAQLGYWTETGQTYDRCYNRKKDVSVIYPEDQDSARKILMGGFVAQVVTSEILLASKDLHQSNFKKGMLTFNVLNSIFYTGTSEDGGDVKDLNEATGANQDKIKTALAMHALFTAYRYYHPEKTELIPEVSYMPKSGVQLQWKIDF